MAKANSEQVKHDMHMKRMLHYRAQHAGWHIFNSVYWGFYLFVVGMIFIFQSSLQYTTSIAVGVSLVILALMVVVFGFVKALHLKFMKKYG